jgi:hypothetical protein
MRDMALHHMLGVVSIIGTSIRLGALVLVRRGSCGVVALLATVLASSAQGIADELPRVPQIVAVMLGHKIVATAIVPGNVQGCAKWELYVDYVDSHHMLASGTLAARQTVKTVECSSYTGQSHALVLVLKDDQNSVMLSTVSYISTPDRGILAIIRAHTEFFMAGILGFTSALLGALLPEAIRHIQQRKTEVADLASQFEIMLHDLVRHWHAATPLDLTPDLNRLRHHPGLVHLSQKATFLDAIERVEGIWSRWHSGHVKDSELAWLKEMLERRFR